MHAGAPVAWLPKRVDLPWVALAIVFGAQCVAGAIFAISEQSPFSEYLAQARRCVELNDCPSRGGRTGGLPLFHGASWIRLLAYSLRSGQDLTVIQSIILAIWIASIPIMFLFLRRYLGLRAAALGLGLYFPIILVCTDITIFTYTNLLPLPFVSYYFAIALFIELRRSVFAVLASVALAAAVSAELGGIVMVPFHFLLVALTASRPAWAIVSAALAFAIPFCLDSMDAALEIIRQIPTVRFAVALVICGGAGGLAVRIGRRVLVRDEMSAPDRVRVAMAAAMIYATATIWLGNVLLSRGVPAPRYFLPASVPFLFLIAERMRRLSTGETVVLAGLQSLTLLLLLFAPRGVEILQVPVATIVTLYALAAVVRPRIWAPGGGAPARWPALAICSCAIAVAGAEIVLVARRGAAQTLTLADSEQLIPALYGAGYTYPQLLAALQGPAVDDMVSLLTERDPDLFKEPPPNLAEPGDSLLVLKVPDEAIARTQGVIAAIPAGGSRSAIVVRDGGSYLDWTRMRRCRSARERGGEEAFICEQPARDEPLPHNWPYVRFRKSDAHPATGHPTPASGGHIRIEVPVHTPGNGRAHVIRTSNEWPATWRIIAVNGVAFEGPLPAAQIRLSDTEDARGSVAFEFDSPIPGDPPWVWMPHVVEVTQANQHLLDILRDGR